jgi:hypothetical protein
VKFPSFIREVLIIGLSFLSRGFEFDIRLVETPGLVEGFASEISLLKLIELHRLR